MIEKILPRPTSSRFQAMTASQCDKGESSEQYVCHEAEHDAVDPGSERPRGIARGQSRARSPLFWAIMAAIMTMFLVLVARSVFVTPLETRVLAEQARSLAKDLDAVVKARCAAIHVAAGSLDIDNLSASGGLERLLADLRAILPDFSSLEIINDEGQTVAMLGNVALSIIGQPVEKQALTTRNPRSPCKESCF